jgi:hypothetical protein
LAIRVYYKLTVYQVHSELIIDSLLTTTS